MFYSPLPSRIEARFAELDRSRQKKGEALAAKGYGPVETPWTALAEFPALTVRSYGEPGLKGPALLIAPAPIKQPYIWDIEPEVSVVRRLLEAGVRVFMIAWKKVGPMTAELGLSDYGDRLIGEALDAVRAETGEKRVFLAGHSLGGTLSTLYGSLHPENLRGLLILESPLSFGENTGAFAKFVKWKRESDPSLAPIPVPGSLLSISSLIASPRTFSWERYQDRIATVGDKPARTTHLRVERWTLDEFAMPRPLFEQVTGWLYGEDRFMAGTLDLNGRIASPQTLTMPLLGVADPRSTVVPFRSLAACFDAAPSPEKDVLAYEGDIGVALQHVGVLVGRNAHRLLWPKILDWVLASRG